MEGSGRDVRPQIGGNKAGNMAYVGGRYNNVVWRNRQEKGLGGKDYVNVQFLGVAGGNPGTPRHCPQIGGA